MARPGRYRFDKGQRLRRRQEFLEVQRSGRRHPRRHITVIARVREQGPARLGLVVSRRVGNAVVRNRVKRLIREAFRTSRHQMPDAVDLVVIARPEAAWATLEQLREELVDAAAALTEAPRRPR